MIDSHIHLDDPRFDPIRDEAITAARALGVTQFVVPGIEVEAFPRLETLRQRYDGIHVAYGLHPYFIGRHQAEHIQALDHWLSEKPCVALGECGLDYYLPALKAQKAAQQRLFLAQVEMARKHRLPLIIHARKSVADVLACLDEVGYYRGEIHSYNGSLEQTRQVLDRGLKLGFGGAVTRPNAHKLHQVVAYVPNEALLLETDAPDQPPWNHRGELNRPEYLPEIATVVAEIRHQPVETLVTQCDSNARNLFGLEDTQAPGKA